MQTIDEISIGRQGDMFTLTIYVYEPDDKLGEPIAEHQRFLIGLPDQFLSETERTIGKWLTLAVEDERMNAQTVADRFADFAKSWPYTPHPVTDAQEGDDD